MTLNKYLRCWFKMSWSYKTIDERITLRGRIQKEHKNCVQRKWNEKLKQNG